MSFGRALLATMAAMQMAGDAMTSMPWTRMPGQTWLGVAASFVGMWMVMMSAMMLPVLAPTLWRYGRAVAGRGRARPAVPTAIVGAGYLFVWAVVGVAVFPSGAALAALVREWPALARAVPAAIGAVVAVAGALQLTRWKAHHLACCREGPACCAPLPAHAAGAWRHGLRLGLHCVCCSAGATAVLLAVGMMDPRAMAAVTAAITVERLAPAGERVARVLGVLGVVTGTFLIASAAGLR